MSGSKATYLDSSAIVKLAAREAETDALRGYLRRRRPLITSALARTEVARALLPLGGAALAVGEKVLRGVEVIRVSDRVLRAAGRLSPPDLRSLDAIHLATAQELGDDLARVCTYDDRMTTAAVSLGLPVVAPR